MIYAEVKFQLSAAKSAHFLQSVAFSSATITSSLVTGNANYKELDRFKEVARCYTMFAYLKFLTQEALDRFLDCGIDTKVLTEADLTYHQNKAATN